MSVLPSFVTAVAALSEPELSGVGSLPVRLAIGCTSALPVDAAGISVMDVLRVPLGASSPDAEIVERLETTIGDGPCIHAYNSGEPVAVDQEQIARMWPIFNDRLVSETQIRSIASLPLRTPTIRLGAIDLYWTKPRGVINLSLAAALELADHIASTLLAEPEVSTLHGVIAPGWLDAAAAQHRMQVWQAVGMLNAARALSNIDAITVLRAYAYGHDTDLDDLAEDLLCGRIALDDVVIDD